MKRTVSLLMSLLLVLSSLSALAMTGDGSIAAPALAQGFSYGFADGDRVLLAGADGLYAWKPGDAEAARMTYDLPELEENETDAVYPFAADGKLYAIRLVTEDDEGELDFGDTALYELTERGDRLEAEEVDSLKWDDMVVYDEDDNASTRLPRQVVADGACAWLVCDNDDSGMSGTTVAKLDIEDCELEVLDALEGIQEIAPYKDGKLLMLQTGEYGIDPSVLVYDPEEEEYEATAFKPELLSTFAGLAYDAERDVVYVNKDGEVCPLNLETAEIGKGIAPLPVYEVFRESSACVCGGIYTLCCGEVTSRALYGRPEITARLRVNDRIGSPAIEEAIARFNAAHDEARVTLTRDNDAQSNLVENMMRQDASIDIYVLDTSMPSYENVFNRGFMLPLNDNAAVSALVAEMYPGIREAITREGKIQALPVFVSGYTLGVSEKVLAKLGLTLADIPDSWDAFLDFLPTLAEPLADHREVKLISGVSNVYGARYLLLAAMISEYINTVNGQKLNVGFNEEPARSLANKIGTIDFEALGIEASQDALNPDTLFTSSFEDEDCLFTSLAGFLPGNFSAPNYMPLKLSLTPDTPSYMSIDCTMAAVNPYTRYPELALEFIGLVAESLPASTRAALVPSINEPVRSAANERALAEARENVARLEAQFESASGANKQLVEVDLNQAKSTLELLEENAWDLSPKALEWYRAHDENVVASGVNWLNTAYGEENLSRLLQYCSGDITGEELLAGFDKTSEMIRREGN